MLSKFKQTYDDLNSSNIAIIDDLYAQDVIFVDPFHEVKNLNNLSRYFAELYQNVNSISFDFTQQMSNGDEHFITWTMTLEHPKLNAGKAFKVAGSTFLRTDQTGKICYHRDYFDAGAMLYEQLPLIRTLIKWIKNKL